jgi:photosystem II stability/assembly factor-like uncharacterized protein
MYIAVSAAGVYRTDDGGVSWMPRNKGISVDFAPERYPEFGQCVHKMVLDPSQSDRLYLQNHGGLFRSDNAGDSWENIDNGVPSNFGFPIVMNPHDADTLYVVPLETPARWVPGAKLRIYRSRNAGKSWEPLSRGLPQKDAYETVLRDAMDNDSLQPAGIYFGTRSGKLFGSRNEGTSWQLIRDGLPPVVCVKAAVLDESLPASAGGSKQSSKQVKKRSGRAAARV